MIFKNKLISIFIVFSFLFTGILPLIQATEDDRGHSGSPDKKRRKYERSVQQISEDFEVPPIQAAGILALQDSLYKDIRSETACDIDLSFFSPTKKEFFHSKGLSSPELKISIYQLKSEVRQPIRDFTNFPPDGPPFSPVVRKTVSRTLFLEANKDQKIRHLPPIAFLEPIRCETPEERALRKGLEKQLFIEAELAIGIDTTHREKEIESILKPLVSYFSFLKVRKSKVAEGMRKIRWFEVAEAFNKYVAPHMTRAVVDQYEIYFCLPSINFDREHVSGVPNHQAMQLFGNCPQGADGQSMNWHHVTQIDPHVHSIDIDDITRSSCGGPYKVILLPTIIHTEYSGNLHFDSSTYVFPQKEINRTLFGDSRKLFNQHIVKNHYKI